MIDGMTNFRSIAAMTVIAACIAAPFLAKQLVVQSLIEPDMMSRSQKLAVQARPSDMAAAVRPDLRN